MFLIFGVASLPLLTISWFNWPALFSVTCILTLYYLIQEWHAENLRSATIAQSNRLDAIISKLDKIIDFTKHDVSDRDAVTTEILSELTKIRKAVRHEVKNL